MTAAASPPTLNLQHLQLDAARATLGPQACAALPPISDATAHVQAIVDGLCELSQSDPLTGIANRRQLMGVLERELDRVARSGDAALLLMIDVDFFKHINDQYGHSAGDLVLQQIAQRMYDCIRPMDTLTRFGGEEFSIVLPACLPGYGRAVAERIRHAVQSEPIRISPVQEVNVTISVGGAFALQWIRSTAALWIERADQQLYLAKNTGRNVVHIEPQPDSTVTAEEKSLLFMPLPDAHSIYADHSAFPSLNVDDPAGSVN